MSLASLLTWIVIGGIAGYVANMVVDRGRRIGILAAIIIGIIGGFIGGWLLSLLHTSVGGGLIGEAITAFIGAVILLIVLRYLRVRV